MTRAKRIRRARTHAAHKTIGHRYGRTVIRLPFASETARTAAAKRNGSRHPFLVILRIRAVSVILGAAGLIGYGVGRDGAGLVAAGCGAVFVWCVLEGV